jgi:hypothetical protein
MPELGPITVVGVQGFDAEKDEDDGYKKPAGPVVAALGSLIGLVLAATIFWYLESHR